MSAWSLDLQPARAKYVAVVSLPAQLVEALEAHEGAAPAPLSVRFDADSAHIEFGSDAFPLRRAAEAGDLEVVRSAGPGRLELVGAVDEIAHAQRQVSGAKRPAERL